MRDLEWEIRPRLRGRVLGVHAFATLLVRSPVAASNGTSERSHARHKMKYWEPIADNLSKAGWSWGCVSAIDSNGRTIWIADAHRDDGKRFAVRADY
jgi:hypothetical protein